MNEYMKPIKFFSLSVSLTAILSVSCSGDFLDQPPLGFLDEDTYITTEDAGFKLLADCYRPILDHWTYQTMKFDMGDQLSDDFSKGGSDANDRIAITDIARGNPLPTNTQLTDLWNHRYQTAIGRCNVFLSLVTPETPLIQAGGAWVSTAEKERWIAEAYFLRAFYYYDLATIFANIPIIDKPLSALDKETIVKEEFAAVIAFILSDLDRAIQARLPGAKELPAAETGRITKEAALAFRARVNLFAKNYEAAKADLKAVIDANCYELADNYEDLFNSAEKGYKSKEAVFITLRTYNPPYAGGSVCPQMNVGRAGAGGWGGECPTNDLVNEYETGDPRLVHTVLSSGDIFVKTDGADEVHDYSGYDNFPLQHSRKQYPDWSRRPVSSLIETDWTFYHIRYADVLLMYAECLVETNGDKQTVVDILNRIRHRAFVTTSPIDAYAKYRKFNVPPNEQVTEATFEAKKVKLTDNLQAAVRHERRVELAGEGLRLYDLLRWGIFVNKMQAFGKSDEGKYSNAGVQVTDKTWPYPIPQNEIDYVGGSLTQNSNY
jgi:hypothetical protein